MMARVCLAVALFAALPGAAISAGQPAAPAPRPARNMPPPRIYAPPQPPAPVSVYVPPPPAGSGAADLAGPGLRAFRVPPQPIYPLDALRADLRGRCIVTFTVDADGVPQDIVPDCTDPVFTAAARDAVAAARLKMDADVKAGATLRLPLRFAIADDPPPQE